MIVNGIHFGCPAGDCQALEIINIQEFWEYHVLNGFGCYLEDADEWPDMGTDTSTVLGYCKEFSIELDINLVRTNLLYHALDGVYIMTGQWMNS